MQRRARSWRVAAILSIVGWAGVSAAQLPVCPQPEPDKPVYSACLPGGRFLIVPLLTDLTIDQLLKGDSGPIMRQPRAIFASRVTAETLEKNPGLTEYLGRLEPLNLTRLDTATGTLRLDVGEEERRFTGTVTVAEAAYSVGLELPARVEGGYWRTPGVLQMAFWRGGRPSFTTRSAAGTAIEAEIECMVVSADGIRFVTSGSSIPDLFVGFDPCP